MADYFTSNHFKLLNMWKEQKRDESNAEQNRAYEELKNAYDVTETWANEVKIKSFPKGFFKIRKRPTSQANFFLRYNWARIYPAADSPNKLAYTVGIEADKGFIVKIDTVGLSDRTPVRRTYLTLRGSLDNASPIVAILPESEGLGKSLAELVDWSIEAIRKFRISYDEMVAKLWPDQLPDESDEESDDKEPPMDTAITQAFNRIYYGPPGTGKTYEVLKLLRQKYEQAITSMSAAKWQSQFIADRIAPLKWWEAAVLALVDLGGKANVSQLLEHSFINALVTAKGRKNNIRQTIWATLQEHTVDESTTVNRERRVSPQVFDKSEDSIWQLAGEWEDACADLVVLLKDYRAGAQSSQIFRCYSFVTFHQSYGYEEFVEGLRPVLDDDTESGAIKYEIRPGAFKDLCRKARLAPDQRFAMVIDEINRGNISKIFGELITLIEPDKRESKENAISVTLPYSGESFAVPPNVDIIGTMNTADRSLALLDTALRRRFHFVPVLPDARDEADAPLFGLRVTLGEQVIDIPQMLSVINQRIEVLYDRDHCIGHAYLTSLAQTPDGNERLEVLAEIFSKRIVPLLEEYFFEDWQKIRLVLADNQKPEAAQFVIESKDHEEDLAHLFGRDHGLDIYATKPRYVVQNKSFINPDAYIGIYKTLQA